MEVKKMNCILLLAAGVVFVISAIMNHNIIFGICGISFIMAGADKLSKSMKEKKTM